jgi:hypothetical protein
MHHLPPIPADAAVQRIREQWGGRGRQSLGEGRKSWLRSQGGEGLPVVVLEVYYSYVITRKDTFEEGKNACFAAMKGLYTFLRSFQYGFLVKVSVQKLTYPVSIFSYGKEILRFFGSSGRPKRTPTKSKAHNT